MANKQLQTLTIDGTSFDPNLVYLGGNPIASVAADTTQTWRNLGTGYCTFDSIRTNGQPTAVGAIVSYVRGSIVIQEWHSFTSGEVYYRGGNGSSDTAMPEWKQLVPGRRLPTTLYKTGTIANFNLASGTATLKDCFTADAAGILFVTCFAQFAANATGSRAVSLYVGGIGAGSGNIQPAAAGVTIAISDAAIARVSSGDKVQIRFLQSSGSALAISNIRYRAYLIKD